MGNEKDGPSLLNKYRGGDAQQELRKSEQTSRRRLEEIESIYASAPVGLCVFDEGLRFVRINEEMAEMNGLPPEEHIGKTPREVVPNIADEAEALHRRMMRRGEPVMDIEIVGSTPACPDEQRTWIEHWLPLKDEDGNVTGISVVAQDVTEKRRLEAALQAERDLLEERVEARTVEMRQVMEELKSEVTERGRAETEVRSINEVLESFFSTTHMQIAYMDRKGFYKRVNEAFARSLVRDPHSLVGKNHFILFPDEENEAIFKRVVETGEPCIAYSKPFEYPDRPELGVTYWDWSLYPIKDKSGEVTELVLYLLDVTERERAKEELERQRAGMVHADRLRSLGEMAASIAHELNQPLVGVRGLAEHMQIAKERGMEMTDEDIIEKSGLIMEQADRMTHVIEHTRSFARGAGGPELSPVNMNEVVEAALTLTRAQLRNKGIEVVCELGEGLPTVNANPFALEQVLLNLLTNARDAVMGDRNSPRQITISTRLAGGESNLVEMRVSDRGPGMPREVIDRVFEPFFTTKGPDRGTGLGLAICKNIVEQFGGRMAVSSKEGEGTKMFVLVPAAPAE